MRISDWSSDVCSSDLCDRAGQRGRAYPLERNACDQRRPVPDRQCGPGGGFRPGGGAVGRTALHRPARPGQRAGAGSADEDRKRVVTGKSVSVRVDRGGRRIIKKKNKEKSK